MQKVDFRYSDTDFVSYLLSVGYKHTSIEITKDHKDRPKAFVHFYEDKTELLNRLVEYKESSVKIDPLSFSANRRSINKLIKAEILKYKSSNI